MKLTIIDWACEATAALRVLGYTSGQELSVEEPFTVAQRIFDSGLNIMLVHGGPNNVGNIILGVDTRRFQQR